MSISVLFPDRIPMSQKERDVLKIMHAVLRGQRTQAEAARLLDKSIRQVRCIQRRLQAGGDAAIVHGLRGKPSNHQPDPELRQAVLAAYRQHYADFGPTFASEKLAEQGLPVDAQTLRRWLIAEGLWQRQRRRETHRSRRPRRACFGELVQMDASIHDWLEGRGPDVVLISMIDDATSRILARFYPEGTVETHMDLLDRWLRRYGRPLALYTDRHSIFEPQDKGRCLPLVLVVEDKKIEALCDASLGGHPCQVAHLDPIGSKPMRASRIEDLPKDALRRYMTADIVTAGPRTRLPLLARMMIDTHIHRIIVVGKKRRPLGIVSSTDLLATIAYADGEQ